ncbi:MAG TPA: UDP-N-acetylmuramoyl-L-alanine--D-glutamate ligase [Actinomycetota bacterium]
MTAGSASVGRFSGEHVVVVGAGVAGAAAAQVLLAEGASVTVSEARPLADLPSAGTLVEAGVVVLAGGHDPSHLAGATLVVTGPGVPEQAPILAWARAEGIQVWGEMELGARICAVPYIAVTGTNGKTTVTGMIAACLQAAGTDAVACGNIGHPFPSAAQEDHQALVVECSSFQLRLQESLHPRVSVLLNLAPDHLDWHGSFDAYAGAKASIYRNQSEDDVHVGNRDDPAARAVSDRAPCPVIWTTEHEPRAGEVGIVDGQVVSRAFGQDEVLANLTGDRAGWPADLAAAATAALAFGVPAEAVRGGLASFTPASHRGETVATVAGVRFIDNSKATNVHAALAAIGSVERAVLIAGGRAKGADLTPLRDVADHLSAVFVIGEAAPQLMQVFAGVVPIAEATSIEEAVRSAFDAARSAGDVVLLAPACASWDQFTDYAERGDRFARAARTLAEVSADGRS